MTCREFVDFLMAYLDGELRGEGRRRFDHHLERCPPCVAYLDTYRTTIELVQTICGHPDDPIPADVPEDLVAAVLAAREAPRS